MKAAPIPDCARCPIFECVHFTQADTIPKSCPLPDVPELPSATTLTLENRYEMMAAFIAALRRVK